jgi:NitT/TauT family transport system substrate-binding protein
MTWRIASIILVLALAAPARAEVSEVRLATQPSMSFMPLFVMKEKRLVEKHAENAGLKGLKVSWTSFNNGGVMNDALLTDNLDFASGGTTAMLLMWGKTRGTRNEVKGVAAVNSIPFYLFSSNPAVKTLKDFGEKDRIAVPAVKSSIQAIILQMAAAKEFGEANWAKLDPFTTSLSHADAYVALTSGKTEINAHFSGPHFQYQQMQEPNLNRILSSYDVMGGPATINVVWSTRRFHDSNPKTYKAVLDAVEEALAFLREDPRSAAEIYVRFEKVNLKPEFLADVLRDPDTRFRTAPERIMMFVDFMVKTGAIKGERPAGWKDLFFAELHDRDGS